MLNILVVDDEAPIRDWIVYCIKRAGDGYNIVGTAKSGKEAYESILKHKPDVVITDIKMPGMDGIELMQLIKKKLPYTVFIILTNYAEFSYAQKAITYGAMEYLLKSELRSVDLINVLETVLNQKKDILDGKNGDFLSNGYVDLYYIFQNHEDKSCNISFLENLGMEHNKPYSIIGIYEDISFDQRLLLEDIAKEISPYYFMVAIRHNIIYIILQEETKIALKESINSVSSSYLKMTNQYVAVGQIVDKLNDFIEEIEQVQSILSTTFFKVQKGIIYYDNLMQVKKLDHNKIRKQYKNILLLISQKQYEKIIDIINEWFDNFFNVNVQDIAWVKEMCIKLVISIEERFYQLNSEYEYSGLETRQLNSAQLCKEICIGMIRTMLIGKDGVKSKSISDALNYIHKNYNKDLSLIEVANHVYRSPEYFSRLFKEEVGENFSVYLMMYRLRRAKQLLETSDLQISQVAYEVGYTTPGYFSRIYKKYMGSTPKEAKSQKSTKRSR